MSTNNDIYSSKRMLSNGILKIGKGSQNTQRIPRNVEWSGPENMFVGLFMLYAPIIETN